MATRVQVINEVCEGEKGKGNWTLCFQYCLYVYDNGESDNGYRFIWRRPNGYLQPARGQARLPSLKVVRSLMAQAEAGGWGEHIN